MAGESWVVSCLCDVSDIKTGKLDSNAAVSGGRYPFFTCSPETLKIDIPAFDCEAVILAGNNANGVFSVKYFQGRFNAYQRTYIITSRDENILNAKYLYYQLRQLKELLGEYSIGTATKFLTRRILDPLPIPLPPIAEQKAIAHILGTLDEKIELNRKMNTTLEAMARALFKSWFVDFDPVRAKLDGRQPACMDAATAALFPGSFQDSSIGHIPTGWKVAELETALSVLEVGGRPKGGVGGITVGIPSIGAESIVGVGHFDFGKTKYVPVEFYEGMKKGHIQNNDVLLYKDGGRPGEYEPHVSMFGDGFPFEKCSINEHVYRLRTNNLLSQEYLYFWLTSELAMAEMRVKGTGVAIPGLNSTAVRSLTVLVPPKLIIEAFAKQAASLVTCILANSKQSRTLANLRDTLLPKLLSGELSVPEAMKEAANA